MRNVELSFAKILRNRKYLPCQNLWKFQLLMKQLMLTVLVNSFSCLSTKKWRLRSIHLHRYNPLKEQCRFMIRHSFQDLSTSAFIPLYEALVRSHLEYGMPACSPNPVVDINHLERIQRLASKLVTSSTKRHCCGWDLIPCSGDSYGAT